MPNKPYQSERWLRLQHYTNKKSIEEIAKLCGVHPLTIRRQMNTFNMRIQN